MRKMDENSAAPTTVLYFYIDSTGNKVPVLVSTGTRSLIYSNLVDEEEIEHIAYQLPERHHGLYALLDGKVFKLQLSKRGEKSGEK